MYHKKKINIVSNSHNPKGLLHTAPQTTINTSLDLGNVWHFCLRKNEQNDQSIVNQNSCQLIFSPKLYFKVNYLCKVSWKKKCKKCNPGYCENYLILGVAWRIYSTLASSSAPVATSTWTTGTGAVLDPVPRAATSKALAVAATLHYLNKSITDKHISKQVISE